MTAPADRSLGDLPGYPVTELGEIASMMRRAVAANAAAVVAHPSDGPPQVVARRGLTAGDVRIVERACAAGAQDELVLSFGAALSASIVFEDERLGSIHALGHDGDGFSRPELASVYATHAAIAIALARASPLRDEQHEIRIDVDELVQSVHDLGDLVRMIDAAIGPLFGGARTALMIADPHRNVLQMSHGGGDSQPFTDEDVRVNLWDITSSAARVFTSGRPYLTNAAVDDSGVLPQARVRRVTRLLTVPLGRVGVMFIANPAGPFTTVDLQRAQALAPRITEIVGLAATLQRLRRQQRLDGILADVAVAVASGSDMSDFFPPSLESLCATMDADLLALVPYDAPAIVSARPGSRDRAAHEARVLAEAATDPGTRAYVLGPSQPGDPGCALFFAPLQMGQERVGTLGAFRAHGTPFAKPERGTLVRIASLAALARTTERYQEQWAELARLQERQRIADDLHDDVAQLLFAAHMRLDALLAGGVAPDVEEGIVGARAMLIRGDTAIRTVIRRLSAPPSESLAARLAAVVHSVEEEFGIAVELRIDQGAVSPSAADEIVVRAAREALVNVAKHAGSPRAIVALEPSGTGELVLTVADEGHGLADGAEIRRGHGLVSLERALGERGGTLEIVSDDTGTMLKALVPIAATAPA